jgi:ribosomal protein S18 acetylase RimI-like enzyme
LVRSLRVDEAVAYNDFLRIGLEAHPDTLRISVADLEAAPFRTEATAETMTLVAVRDDGSWLGVTTVERERGREKRRHVAWLLRMYVDAAVSGAGVGRALLRAGIAKARAMHGVSKLNLTVAEHNQRAIALYTSEGFRVFGREEDAFRDALPRCELSLSLTFVARLNSTRMLPSLAGSIAKPPPEDLEVLLLTVEWLRLHH